jgi:hypothetical protein
MSKNFTNLSDIQELNIYTFLLLIFDELKKGWNLFGVFLLLMNLAFFYLIYFFNFIIQTFIH